jgi:hypothetical protein
VFVAEIGDVTRFPRPEQLASWAGLTPRHHESDTTCRRGRITKQGSRLVRWAAVEAVQRVPAHTRLGRHRDRVGERRGHNAGVFAAGREVVVLVLTACAITASATCPPGPDRGGEEMTRQPASGGLSDRRGPPAVEQHQIHHRRSQESLSDT